MANLAIKAGKDLLFVNIWGLKWHSHILWWGKELINTECISRENREQEGYSRGSYFVKKHFSLPVHEDHMPLNPHTSV